MSTEFDSVKYLPPNLFHAIKKKEAVYIAKPNVGFWNCLSAGNKVYFTDGENHLRVAILCLSYFKNFEDAWFTYQDKLIPSSVENIVCANDAKLFSKQNYKTADEIVVFHVKLMESDQSDHLSTTIQPLESLHLQ